MIPGPPRPAYPPERSWSSVLLWKRPGWCGPTRVGCFQADLGLESAFFDESCSFNHEPRVRAESSSQNQEARIYLLVSCVTWAKD